MLPPLRQLPHSISRKSVNIFYCSLLPLLVPILQLITFLNFTYSIFVGSALFYWCVSCFCCGGINYLQQHNALEVECFDCYDYCKFVRSEVGGSA